MEAERLSARQSELAAETAREAAELQRLGLRLESMEGNPHLVQQHRRLAAEVARLASRVKAAPRALRERRRARVLSGALARSSLRGSATTRAPTSTTPPNPVPLAQMRFGRVAELRAAFSLSMLLIGVVALIQFARWPTRRPASCS